MPTYEQAIQALRAADAAGNVEDARKLAQIASKLKGHAETANGPVDFSALEMVKNIPGSAGKFAKDLITPIIHPIDTSRGLYNLARGAAEKLIPNTINGVDFGPDQHEAYADAVGKFFKDRYGSVDNVKRTAQEDPVGMLTDISMLLTGGGSAMMKVGKISKVGKAANVLGKAIDPLNIVINTAKYSAGKLIPKALPRAIYSSGAKLVPMENRAKLTDTAVTENLMATGRGVQKINKVMDDLRTSVNTLVDNATKEGKLFPKDALYQHLKGVRQQLGGIKLEGGKDLNKINRVVKDFETHLKANFPGKKYLTPRELQDLKVDLNNRINWLQKRGKGGYAKTKTKQAIVRSAKEQIESINPEIKSQNRRLGDLLELKPSLEQAANRIEGQNIIGISAPLDIGAGAVAGGKTGTVAGTLAALVEMPRTKMYGGLKLESLRNTKLGDLLENSTLATLMRQGAIQSGRLYNQ